MKRLDEIWNARRRALNERLAGERPARARSPTCRRSGPCCYTQPSRYNWMLQYYLRAEGLALSWVGTGRLIFSLNYTDADFEAVADRFVRAAQNDAARRLVVAQHAAATNQSIKRRILKEMLRTRFGIPVRAPRASCVLLLLLRTAVTARRISLRSIEFTSPRRVERRLVVELDVVERVGEDLRRPDQAGLHVLR